MGTRFGDLSRAMEMALGTVVISDSLRLAIAVIADWVTLISPDNGSSYQVPGKGLAGNLPTPWQAYSSLLTNPSESGIDHHRRRTRRMAMDGGRTWPLKWQSSGPCRPEPDAR